MSSTEQIRTLTAYNYALYDKVWDSIMHLTDAQFTEEVGYSHGSVRNQIVHVARTDVAWLRGLRDLPGAREFTLDPADYPTRADARALWETTAREVMEYVNGLDEATLQRQPQGMMGPAWQALLHLANHGTDHRAQILRNLHDLGAPTFDQDLIFHLWYG